MELSLRNGARKYTEHCMGVTGAVFLAKSGVDVSRIMAWGDDLTTVEHSDPEANSSSSSSDERT